MTKINKEFHKTKDGSIKRNPGKKTTLWHNVQIWTEDGRMKMVDRNGLAPGVKIRITDIDMFGFTGRDHHPEEKDMGREGKILRLLAGYQAMGSEEKVYEVRMNDQSLLELVDYEFKVIQ